jgi:TBC1 domain family member 2A
MISEGTADVLVSADLYGFPLRSLTVVQQARRLQCEGSTLRTEAEWLPSVHAGQLPPPARLKDLARRGVPPALRPLVWLQASGAEARRAAALPGKNYTDAAAAGEASKWLPHIEQVRSQRNVPCMCALVFLTGLQKRLNCRHSHLVQLEGQAALRRVLAAFSMHNPVIGYARGLNNVSALLLVVFNRQS